MSNNVAGWGALYFIPLIQFFFFGRCLAAASEPNNKASRHEPRQARGVQTVWSGFNFGSSWFTHGWARSKVSISVDGNLYLVVNPVRRRPCCCSETTMSYGQMPLPDRRESNLDASVSVRRLSRSMSQLRTFSTDTLPNAPESRSGARASSPIYRRR